MTGIESPNPRQSYEDIESRLLIDPVVNAGDLYDVYQAMLIELATHFAVLENDEEKDSFALSFRQICDRQLEVSKLLPEDDPRSYIAWKKEFNKSA